MDDSPDFEQPDTARPYADWKAPAGDGELLIWPGPPGLLDGEGDENGRAETNVKLMGDGRPIEANNARPSGGI